MVNIDNIKYGITTVFIFILSFHISKEYNKVIITTAKTINKR